MRKKDAALGMSLGTWPCEDHETEPDKVLNALMDIAATGLHQNESVLDFDSATGHRISLQEFRIPPWERDPGC